MHGFKASTHIKATGDGGLSLQTRDTTTEIGKSASELEEAEKSKNASLAGTQVMQLPGEGSADTKQDPNTEALTDDEGAEEKEENSTPLAVKLSLFCQYLEVYSNGFAKINMDNIRLAALSGTAANSKL